MSKTFNKNIPYTFTGSIILPTSSNLNITSNSNTIGNIFTTGGNIGIGTTAPAYTLDINGAFRSNNINYLTSTTAIQATTNNYSLTSGSLNVSGDIVLSGTELMFTQTNIGPPSLNGRSSGSKIVLYPSQAAGTGDFSMGIDFGTMWFQVPVQSHVYRFYHGTTANFNISTAGNVGIGITSPATALHIYNPTNSINDMVTIHGGASGQNNGGARIFIGGNANHYSAIEGYHTDNGKTWIKLKTTGNVTGGAPNSPQDRVIIDWQGNVGIGTATPRRTLEVVGGITTDWNNSNRFIGMEYLDGTEYKMGMNMAGATRNLTMIAQSGDNTGNILFSTGSTPTERMRITPAGYVGIGTTAAQSNFTTTLNGGVHISASGAMDNGTYSYCQIVLNDTDIAARSHLSLIRSGQSVSFFKVNTSNQLVISMGGGGVYLANNATSWTAVSDRTMKTDFADIVAPLDKLSQIKGTYYRYLTDASDVKRVGVIAQDVQAVLPEAVSEDVDGILGVSYTEIIPLAIEAIKELKTKNNELQTYIQALETRLTKLEQQ